MKWLVAFFFFPLCVSAFDPFLSRFERPFTLLELDSDQSLDYVARYPDSVFVVWSKGIVRESSNSVTLRGLITPQKIERLGDCEHFDVIVTPQLSEAICQLGDYFVLPFEEKSLIPTMHKYHAVLVMKNESWVVLKKKKHYLYRKFWVRDKDQSFRYKIKANFKKKFLHKYGRDMAGEKAESSWLPGINLVTFKMLEGSYPSLDRIEKEFKRLQTIEHPDWMINNMLVCGTQLKLIDFEDPRRSVYRKCSQKRLNFHLQLMKEKKLERFTQRLHEGFPEHE